MEKHDKVIFQLENRKKMVIEFISKGEKFMKDPLCPKFLQGHVRKLLCAWEETNLEAQKRKKNLLKHMYAWSAFEDKKAKCHQQLEILNVNHDSIRKIFDLKQGQLEYNMKAKRQREGRNIIEGLYNETLITVQSIYVFLPIEKQKDFEEQVKEIETRMQILEKTDKKLLIIDDFNTKFSALIHGMSDISLWLSDGESRLNIMQYPLQDEEQNPETRVTKVMELQEDLLRKSDITEKLEQIINDIFPKPGEKIPSEAKLIVTKLKELKTNLNKLIEEANKECKNHSENIKLWAQFQTGIRIFSSWLKKTEERRQEGLTKPKSLVNACEILGECKMLLEESEKKFRILEAAAEAARNMTSYQEAELVVDGFRNEWTVVHECFKKWVAR